VSVMELSQFNSKRGNESLGGWKAESEKQMADGSKSSRLKKKSSERKRKFTVEEID
jgi:hypothetical protein